MPLTRGTRLGAYEIVEQIGAGGMGEVYRAHDPALKRDVAIKIVSAVVDASPDRHARFEREARLLASLNHPHIASVYGLVEDVPATTRGQPTRGIVMELVEGPTLADRLASGALPLPDALRIAREIALALEAAHDKGIVHRDLKPANIKVPRSGPAKVLDFGIAKALHSDADAADATTVEATREGVVVGTAAYMSPEQMRGEAIDTRTDVWAFGCVLFEMLTGQRAFAGATPADTLARVLGGDADWRAIPATVPRRLARVVRGCLEKDPAKRWRNIADVRLILEDADGSGELPAATSNAPWRLRVAVLGAAAIIAVGIAAYVAGGAGASRSGETPSAVTMLAGVEPPSEPLYQFVDPVKISPDGKQLAMVTTSQIGRSRLWLRSLGALTPEVVPEADGAMFPFWSPDSRSLGFCADGQIKILDLASRALRVLVPATGPVCAGSWNRNQILFSRAEGLALVPAAGGEPRALTTVDKSKGEMLHGFPQFLPDGRHFVYLAAGVPQNRVVVGAIDSQDVTVLPGLTSTPVYAEPGYLIFAQGNDLVAQRFDPARLALSGDPVRIGNDLRIWTAIGTRGLSLSDTGVLVLMTRRIVTTELTWYERSGRPVGTLGEPGEWVHIAVSPDERTVAAERLEAKSILGKIWTIDVGRNVTSRFTVGEVWDFAPIWSPDSSRLAFASTRTGVVARPLDGGESTIFAAAPGPNRPTDWTEERLLVSTGYANGPAVWSIDVKGKSPTAPLVNGADAGVISPDRKWVAYHAAGSGRLEVYVRALTGGRPVQISRAGGSQPRWRRDGKELFFVSADRKIVAVAVTTGAAFTAAEPQILPIDTQPDTLGNRHTYDVAALGTRFLVMRPTGIDPTPQIAVILNWRALMKAQ